MLITCFDSEGLIHKKFVFEGFTVNQQCYLRVMQRWLARIRRVRLHYKVQSSWWLLHVNAPSHKCIAVRNFLTTKSVRVLEKPTYSPDMWPYDWFVPQTEKGLWYDTISVIQKTSTAALKTITKQDYQRCIQKLYDRCKDCISSKEMYFLIIVRKVLFILNYNVTFIENSRILGTHCVW